MKNKLFIVLLAIAVLIRIINLGSPLFEDEHAFLSLAADTDKGFLTFNTTYHGNPFVWPHEPLSILIFRVFLLTIPGIIVAMRLVPFIFSLMTMASTYLFVRKQFSQKAAVISTLVMAFSFWHVLASMQVDIDGSMLMFFLSSAIYSFIIAEQCKSKLWRIISGVCFGFALLSKLPTLLFLAIIGAYILFTGIRRQRIIDAALISGIGLLMYVPFPILFSLLYPSVVSDTYLYAQARFSILPTIMPLVYLIIWGGPLLIAPAALASKDRKNLPFYLWALVFICAYMFVGSLSPFDKYLMPIIPALAILAGVFISQIEIKPFHLAVTGLLGIAVLFFLNSFTTVLPHSIENYLRLFFMLRWNFFLPLTGPSGPSIGINFFSLALLLIACAVSLGYFLMNRKLVAFSIFLGLSLALNVYLIQELTFHKTYPDVGATTLDMIEYVIQEERLSPPYVTNTVSTEWYLDRGGHNTYRFVYNTPLSEVKDMLQESATAIIVDYPKLSPEYFKLFNKCDLKKIFSSNDRNIGYIYSCK